MLKESIGIFSLSNTKTVLCPGIHGASLFLLSISRAEKPILYLLSETTNHHILLKQRNFNSLSFITRR